MLSVRELHVGYGESSVLQGLSLEVSPGEIVAVLGRNGAGKTTLLNAVMGALPIQRGTIAFDDRNLARLPSYRIARLGIGYVPQGRHIFGTLTVLENFTAVQRAGTGTWKLEDIWSRFPNLAERRDVGGKKLSGGEQQMLAVGRALMTNSKLLLLDEPSEGLSPIMVDELVKVIRDFRSPRTAVVLVEQNLDSALRCADRLLVMGRGNIQFETSSKSPDSLARVEELLSEVPMGSVVDGNPKNI